MSQQCPVCLVNNDSDAVDNNRCAMCAACGQLFCGGCAPVLAVKVTTCPVCRASLTATPEVEFARLMNLVTHRPLGRYTAVAENSIGIRYEHGDGIAANIEIAVTWYGAAAAKGYALAQTNLATKYYAGDGVSKSMALAQRWYGRAAGQGERSAQYNLGAMYLKGDAVAQDTVAGFRIAAWLFQLAALQNHDAAKRALQIMQDANCIRCPAVGDAVMVVLLETPAGRKYNGMHGCVVRPSGRAHSARGRVPVVVQGRLRPMLIQMKNLMVEPLRR